MLNPSIDTLIDKVGNRYTLCILAAKRARTIIESENLATEEGRELERSAKPLSDAIGEILDDKVSINIPEPPQDRI